ncbi:cytotoxic T-lymphocyte protein 4 isoform X1 [Pezoporus wallicus]|uniref:cytotoxic T-lymphocyte protein 4 isoform X1 n=1 Tax=Pezoporus wallicus TaxID=35540 RepID=UPI00254CDE6F|nr:cytotoxic T-lymphocyte protein 4 isoform X1 [Pezoporus wallicus]XP_057267721.1 cytotoxic T-lymphocyte protein 4 isoform X1 [Pezoporus wallicus]
MLSVLVTVGFLCTATAIVQEMEVTQPAMVLANRQGVANLVCKYEHIGNAKEIRVTLLKQTGDQFTEICASTYTSEFKTLSVEEVIQCHVSPSRNNVTLTLTGLQANDTGLYICKMERMYPPPYFMNKGNGTHLYVIDPEPCPDTAIYLWVLGATASGLFLYSIIISAILVGKVVSPSTQARPANNTPLCDGDKEKEKRTGKNTGNKCPGILLFTDSINAVTIMQIERTCWSCHLDLFMAHLCSQSTRKQSAQVSRTDPWQEHPQRAT